MIRNCDPSTNLALVFAACSLVACSADSSLDEAMNQPSGAQVSIDSVDSTSLSSIDGSILSPPAESEVTGDIPGSGAAVEATSIPAAASALPDETEGVEAEAQAVDEAQYLPGTEVQEVEEENLTKQDIEEPDKEERDAQEPLDLITDAANDANFCDGFISHADSVVIPQLSKPDYLEPYIDPAFGSRVVRISDSAFGEVNKPAYSSMQAWNSDESYMLLYRTGTDDAGHKLLDGNTYEFIRDLDIAPSDIEQVFWSHTDADIFYYISKRSADYGQLKQFNVSTNSDIELANFSDFCEAGLPSAGNDVQMQSVTDDLFGFTCQQDDGHYRMLSFQPSTGAITSAPIGMGTSWTEWSAPVPVPKRGWILASRLCH